MTHDYLIYFLRHIIINHTKSTIYIHKYKLLYTLILTFILGCPVFAKKPGVGSLNVGWATTDITPDKSVLLAGQFYARVSEGVKDPITATVLALESTKEEEKEALFFISVDVVSISDGMRNSANFRDAVREKVRKRLPSVAAGKIILNATHTHAAPVISTLGEIEEMYGVSLDLMSPGKEVMPPGDYLDWAAERVALAAVEAWANREEGGVSFGLSHAVVARNRLQAGKDGKSLMYGNTNNPNFSHIEGYEDHSLNLIYTWDKERNLTGVVVNIAAPSQVSEHLFELSADFWFDVKAELHDRLGKEVFVLPQVSAAGDLSPHVMIDGKAEERMQKLMGWESFGTGRSSFGQRKQIADRIVTGILDILEPMKGNINWSPVLNHQYQMLNLPRRLLGPEDVAQAAQEAEEWGEKYRAMLAEVKGNPEKAKEPRWYRDITSAYTRMRRGEVVRERFELEKVQPTLPIEVHVVRIDDAVIATNPFELYLDYGMQIKAQSKATQTFVVQLAGSGSYLPTRRSIAGGAYGAVPASTLIGPEGGEVLVEETLKMINSVFP